MSQAENGNESRDLELPDHHPYKSKRGKTQQYSYDPYCIYYYHVTDVTTDPWTVKHYFVSDNGDIRPGDLKERARDLGMNANRKFGDPPKHYGAPPVHGCNLEDIHWTRVSYLMFVFDIPGLKLKKEKQSLKVEHAVGNQRYLNHTFFDADDFTVDLSEKGDGSHKREGVVCVNYMQKNMNGERLKAYERGQYFVLNFDFENDKIGGRDIRQPDSGGTNQGGGVPPPEI